MAAASPLMGQHHTTDHRLFDDAFAPIRKKEFRMTDGADADLPDPVAVEPNGLRLALDQLRQIQQGSALTRLTNHQPPIGIAAPKRPQHRFVNFIATRPGRRSDHHADMLRLGSKMLTHEREGLRDDPGYSPAPAGMDGCHHLTPRIVEQDRHTVRGPHRQKHARLIGDQSIPSSRKETARFRRTIQDQRLRPVDLLHRHDYLGIMTLARADRTGNPRLSIKPDSMKARAEEMMNTLPRRQKPAP